MRRRTFRRRSRKAGWSKKHWAMLGGLNTEVGVESQWPQVTGMWSSPILVTQDYDSVGDQARVTALRVVGDIVMAPVVPGDTVGLWLAIIEADEAAQAGTIRWPLVANTETDPGNPNFYVQQRILWCGVGITNAGTGSLTLFERHVDVRVPAKLEEGRGLFLVGRASGFDGSDQEAYLLMNWRTLFLE